MDNDNSPEDRGDANLQAAVADIQRIIEKHRLMAVMVVSSPTHTECVQVFSAPWGCVRQHGGKIRVVADANSHPSAEDRKKAVVATVSTLSSMAHYVVHCRETVGAILSALGEAFGISGLGRGGEGPAAREASRIILP